jgi:hypothetical protein
MPSHAWQRMQLAAMALSPLAALSLPLVNNEGWLQSMREFADQLRRKVRVGIDQDSFKQQVKQLDNNMTFMDWTYKVTGVDLTYVWDPELWVKFKEAIWLVQPNIVWNELMDRVEYSECALGVWILEAEGGMGSKGDPTGFRGEV